MGPITTHDNPNSSPGHLPPPSVLPLPAIDAWLLRCHLCAYWIEPRRGGRWGGGERPAVRPPPGEVVVEVGHLGLGFLRVRG
jgi:hypothetical protein